MGTWAPQLRSHQFGQSEEGSWGSLGWERPQASCSYLSWRQLQYIFEGDFGDFSKFSL